MKRWLIVLLVLVPLAALIVWRITERRAATAALDQGQRGKMRAAPVVSVAPVSIEDVVQTFDTIGNVESPFSVNLAPKSAGRIAFLGAIEGDRVRRGQPLIKLDPVDMLDQLRQAQADLAEAQSRLAQARLTQDSSNVQVTSQIRQQQAALASANANFEEVRQTSKLQLAAAEADIADAQAKADSAASDVKNAQAALRSAQANLENARPRYNRAATLAKKGFISQQALDDAQTEVNVQEANLDVARSRVDSAQSAVHSMNAQLTAVQKQAAVVSAKGKSDVEVARTQVTQAKAALDYAQANISQKSAYAENLAALRASAEAARASVNSAKARLADLTIVSPVDGYVTARNLNPGATATPGQAILVVQSVQRVWVTVTIPDQASSHIVSGEKAEVRFDSLPGRVFVGRISQVNPSADPVSRQFSVRIELPNPDNVIKPGMFARVRLVTDRVMSAITVPREAIKQSPDEGSYVVTVDSDNQAHRVPVQTGASNDRSIAVTGDLQAREKVVVMSATDVRDGQQVRIEGATKPGREGRPKSSAREAHL